MRLRDHDLKQFNREYFTSLAPEQLVGLAEKLLNDLRDARDRQNQTPQNSSRPSGSYAPWEQTQLSDPQKQTNAADSNEGVKEEKSKNAPPVTESNTVKGGNKAAAPKKRKSGKQRGAKGFGRKVKRPVTGEEIHKADKCGGCGAELGEAAPFERRTGSYTLDIKQGEFGLTVTNILHIYGITGCGCGHWTESAHGRCEREAGWDVEITEWHLVGSTLAALIICLSLRMRQSRPRIREFLAGGVKATLRGIS